jgi:RNA polymerase sigma-70 factor (ECF subfamily)
MTTKTEKTKQVWIKEVLDQYEGALLRYAGRYLGDLERARDVVQETFLRLWSRHKGPPPESIAPWLFTVCRNCALDVLRKENRMNPLDEEKLETYPAVGKNPRQAVEEQETGTHLARALHKLPFKQQEVLRLKFQENLSYREISQVTGYTETNVGFLIHTAIRSLRQDMQAGR